MTFCLAFAVRSTVRLSVFFIAWSNALRQQYLKILQLLEVNPFHPSLRLHALQGRLEGLHSVSINLSYRITLELLLREQEVIPVNVGSHDAVY